MGTQTILKSKPSIKKAGWTLLEGGAFGLVLVGGDIVDNKMNNDKESFRSASTLIPVITALATVITSTVTKGGAERASLDLQLMSTPVAILQIGRIIQKKDLFGKIFKKKASNNMSDHFRGSGGEKHGDTDNKGASGLVDVTNSSFEMLG